MSKRHSTNYQKKREGKGRKKNKCKTYVELGDQANMIVNFFELVDGVGAVIILIVTSLANSPFAIGFKYQTL